MGRTEDDSEGSGGRNKSPDVCLGRRTHRALAQLGSPVHSLASPLWVGSVVPLTSLDLGCFIKVASSPLNQEVDLINNFQSHLAAEAFASAL